MSGAESAPQGGWGLKVGGFIKAHPDWRIGADATAYTAQRKTDGRPRGPVLRGGSLDELAAKIKAAS